MKRLLVMLLIFTVMGAASIALAQDEVKPLDLSDIISKMPNIDNGIYYSLIDNRFNYSATIKLIGTKDKKFALNIGYAGRAKFSMDKAVLTASGNLLELRDYLDIPILDLIVFDPYLACGYGRLDLKQLSDSEFDFGIGANIIKVNW